MHVPRVIRSAVRQGATTALTLTKLHPPQADLGAVALGVPKETFDKELEEAKSAVAPLVAATVGIVDDRLLLINEYPEEEDAPMDPLVSP